MRELFHKLPRITGPWMERAGETLAFLGLAGMLMLITYMVLWAYAKFFLFIHEGIVGTLRAIF